MGELLEGHGKKGLRHGELQITPTRPTLGWIMRRDMYEYSGMGGTLKTRLGLPAAPLATAWPQQSTLRTSKVVAIKKQKHLATMFSIPAH